MQTMGEPLEPNEMQYMLDLSADHINKHSQMIQQRFDKYRDTVESHDALRRHHRRADLTGQLIKQIYQY